MGLSDKEANVIGEASTARTVFISYSRDDKDYLERLQKHLKPHVRDGTIPLWVDTQINPGDKWREQIELALASTQVAILLVSVSFLASDFVAREELPRLLAAAEERGAHILPVLVTPSSFEYTPLSRFQAVNDPVRPLSLMPQAEQDVVWVKVVKRVREILKPVSDLPLPRMRSQAGKVNNTWPVTLTQWAIIVHWLDIILGILAFLAVITAIVIGKIASNQLDFTNVLAYIAYWTSLGSCCLEVCALAIYRQWRWLVGLLTVGVAIYLSNVFFVFGSWTYIVDTIILPVLYFGWFYTSRRTGAMMP